MAPSFIADDLEVLHKDFSDDDLRTGDGAVVIGFISEDEAVSEYSESGVQLYERRFILRSATKYPVGSVIVKGNSRYSIVSVEGDERAWRHSLRKAAAPA